MNRVHISSSGVFRVAILSLTLASAGCVIVDGQIQMGGPEVVGTFQKAETVSGEVDVEVKNGSGNTTVHGSSDGQVRVEGKVHVRAGDMKRGEEILAQIIQNPPMMRVGKTITIGEFGTSQFPRSSISVDMTIFMPKGSRLRSHSGSGDQNIQDLSGDVDLVIGSGDLQATNLGGRFTAHTGSGDMTLRDVRGDVVLKAGSGDIRAENLSGRTEVGTGSGDVRLSYLGAEVQAHTASGEVTIREAKAGMRVRSASGDITVDSILVPAAYWEIESVSGDVDMRLPASSQFAVDASSRSGKIGSDFQLPAKEDEGGHSTLQGSVGQSDSKIRVRTISGRIRIRKG